MAPTAAATETERRLRVARDFARRGKHGLAGLWTGELGMRMESNVKAQQRAVRLVVALAITAMTLIAAGKVLLSPMQQGVLLMIPLPAWAWLLLSCCISALLLRPSRPTWSTTLRVGLLAPFPAWVVLALWYRFGIDIYSLVARTLPVSWFSLPCVLWLFLGASLFVASVFGTYVAGLTQRAQTSVEGESRT